MLDQWKLHDFDPNAGIAAAAHTEAFDDHDWLPIAVPGDVHRTLINAGRIPNPFYDHNEELCAWMEDREWWYRTRFSGLNEPLREDERIELIFHGLDTFATIWLNGEELGRHRNMFRPAVFDLSQRVRIGAQNTLALCFHRPLDQLEDMDVRHWEGRPDVPRVAMRKAQFVYGWDWAPRLPTIGIWRPVELRRQRRALITGVHCYTLEIDRSQQHALVAVRVEVDCFVSGSPIIARITLTAPSSPDSSRSTVERWLRLAGDQGSLTATTYLPVNSPQLWWTHDLGKPTLYDLRVTLSQNFDELDHWQQSVGIRTIHLDQSTDPEEPGTRFFRFLLNDVPIFAKGANWIPTDSFVGAIPDERYATLVRMARDANMNMLRVWGGGIYEHDQFYQLCDRLGILVWQDFMFACAMYPENNATFRAEVEAEACYQVRRLRNHPSLALWCANNESQWLYERHHWYKQPSVAPGALYYDSILPTAVATWDGHIPYWSGSPYGGNDHNSTLEGDTHNWQVWHGNLPRRFGEEPRHDPSPKGVAFQHYAADMGRFISEFGMHAAPVYETLRRVIPPGQRFHHSPAMDHHNKDYPKNKGDNLMQSVTGLPHTLDEYIDFSMIAQAEGLKFGVEHYRRRMPHCGGTLVWQLNDCWPGLSWSVLDYYGFGKASYFYLKRAYSPVLASFKALDNGGIELWITNATLRRVHDQISVRLSSFSHEHVWEETELVSVPAQRSQRIATWDLSQLTSDARHFLSVRSGTMVFPQNRHFFVSIQNLQRPVPAPVTTITAISYHQLQVTVHADAYAYFVHARVPYETSRFSDNYVDIEPGEQRTITITDDQRALTPDLITLGWR